jgi:hypothetical protein
MDRLWAHFSIAGRVIIHVASFGKKALRQMSSGRLMMMMMLFDEDVNFCIFGVWYNRGAAGKWLWGMRCNCNLS